RPSESPARARILTNQIATGYLWGTIHGRDGRLAAPAGARTPEPASDRWRLGCTARTAEGAPAVREAEPIAASRAGARRPIDGRRPAILSHFKCVGDTANARFHGPQQVRSARGTGRSRPHL